MILRPQYYLSFDGVDDYVESRTNAVGDFVLPITIEIEPTGVVDFDLIGNWDGTAQSGQWVILERTTGGFGIVNRVGATLTVNTDAPAYTFVSGNRYLIEGYQDGADFVIDIDGIEHIRTAMSNMTSAASQRKLRIGGRSNTPEYYEGKIYSFQIGTETFPMNEGTGTTITGSEGTVLDIYGATWGVVDEDITDMYVGSTKVQRAYSGSTLMYQTI